jgi:hypothetical protein
MYPTGASTCIWETLPPDEVNDDEVDEGSQCYLSAARMLMGFEGL